MEENQQPTAQDSPETPTSAPLTPAPSTPDGPETPPTTPEPATSQTTTTDDKEVLGMPQQPEQTAAKPSGSHKQLLVMAVAVVVFIGLLGAVGYMYMQKNKTAIKTGANQSQQSASNTPTAASTVDDAAKTIDNNIDSIDSSKDFTSNDLSDATLGL